MYVFACLSNSFTLPAVGTISVKFKAYTMQLLMNISDWQYVWATDTEVLQEIRWARCVP